MVPSTSVPVNIEPEVVSPSSSLAEALTPNVAAEPYPADWSWT
jgi:hypothetical protein